MRYVFAALLVAGIAVAQEAPPRKEWPITGRDESALRYFQARGAELEQRRKQLQEDEQSFHALVIETMAAIASDLHLEGDEAKRLTFGQSLVDKRKTVFFLVPEAAIATPR